MPCVFQGYASQKRRNVHTKPNSRKVSMEMLLISPVLEEELVLPEVVWMV